MRAEDEKLARALPYFSGLATASIGQLLDGAQLQRFPPHGEIIRQGERPGFLHVIVEGRVEVFTRHGERETTTEILDAGACFILAAVVLDKPYLKSARALTPVRLLLIRATRLRRVFAEDPVFAQHCGTTLAIAYRSLVKEVSNLKLRPSIERLANWLLQHARREDGGGRLVIPFDKKTLAAKLGIAPEVLSRNFAALAPHGVIVTGKSVEVVNIARLAAFARPSPLIDDPDY